MKITTSNPHMSDGLSADGLDKLITIEKQTGYSIELRVTPGRLPSRRYYEVTVNDHTLEFVIDGEEQLLKWFDGFIIGWVTANADNDNQETDSGVNDDEVNYLLAYVQKQVSTAAKNAKDPGGGKYWEGRRDALFQIEGYLLDGAKDARHIDQNRTMGPGGYTLNVGEVRQMLFEVCSHSHRKTDRLVARQIFRSISGQHDEVVGDSVFAHPGWNGMYDAFHAIDKEITDYIWK